MGCGCSSLHYDKARQRAPALLQAGFTACVKNGDACTCSSTLVELPEPKYGISVGIKCSRRGPDPVIAAEVRSCKRFKAHSP